MLARLGSESFEIIVIGGGATGLGIAVDASSVATGPCCSRPMTSPRERRAAAPSSSTVECGYLEQLNFSLVTEALRERGLLYRNAAHLVHNLGFVVPRYKWWEGPFYGIGLKLYDALAGDQNLTKSRGLDRDETVAAIPNVEQEDLVGGTMYHDAQFDDARMAMSLALTAADHGGVLLNRMEVVEILKTDGVDGPTCGVVARDDETGELHRILANVVVNATGIFADSVRWLDQPEALAMTTPSQGVHLVLDSSFQPGPNAIMVPDTDDGRVLFVIPWHGRVLVGTTDTPMPSPELEPRALGEEIEFILRNAGRYMSKDPGRGDVLSVFAGQRPLVKEDETASTKKISREHVVVVSNSGLVTILGGKWTTYRKMAEDTLVDAIQVGGLAPRRCVTEELRLHGAVDPDGVEPITDFALRAYGSEAAEILALADEDPSWAALLHPNLPYTGAQVIWGVRHEMARSLDDTLARRTRCLLLGRPGLDRDRAEGRVADGEGAGSRRRLGGRGGRDLRGDRPGVSPRPVTAGPR